MQYSDHDGGNVRVQLILNNERELLSKPNKTGHSSQKLEKLRTKSAASSNSRELILLGWKAQILLVQVDELNIQLPSVWSVFRTKLFFFVSHHSLSLI